MPDGFDVFLSHNSRDKPVVEEIGSLLEGQGLRVWLDKWELRPGFPWQEGLEEGIQASRAGAVFVGVEGLGSWQEPEMRAFIARSRREKIPVIPVLLPGCPESPQLTVFLEAFTWVDLRDGLTEAGLARLLWGITGKKPAGTGATEAGAAPRFKPMKPRRKWWKWGIAIPLIGLAVTFATRLWPRSPAPLPQSIKPGLYAVRVQVLDPQDHPIEGAMVRTSAGNEPHRLSDGWWEIQIPAVKVPKDGKISLWADHPDWTGNRVDLTLGDDPNPPAQIHLKEPETWIRGRVEAKQALAGFRISRKDGGLEEAMTDEEGRFQLNLSGRRGVRVRLRAERAGSEVGDNFCLTGTDNCSIPVERP
jgi:hypothetical protein